MKMFKFNVFILVFVVHISAATAEICEKHDDLVANGISTITENMGVRKIILSIKSHVVPDVKFNSIRPQEPTNSCTYAHVPCSLVSNLSISIGGKRVFVPRSVFADLSDLTRAEISENGANIVIVLNGGDASEAYLVKIYLKNGKIVKRQYFVGERSKPIEETSYRAPDPY